MASRIIEDLTGRTFGSWTVGTRAENASSGSTRWNVACACGFVAVRRASKLRAGVSTQCMECAQKAFHLRAAQSMELIAKARAAMKQTSKPPMVRKTVNGNIALGWTPEQDEAIRRVRAQGGSWYACGLAVNKAHTTCRKRIMEVLRESDPYPVPMLTVVRPALSPTRSSQEPLPPFSSVTWGALMENTPCLTTV